MIRFGYLLPRVVFVFLIYLFFYLFFDNIVKWSIEKSFEAFFKAKVDIKELKISFLKGLFEIRNMSVGSSNDEFRNIFEFKNLRFELNIKHLFRKKFVVEEAKIEGLLFNGKRKTSAKIKKTKSKGKDGLLNDYVDKYLGNLKNFAMERYRDLNLKLIEQIDLEKQELETLKIIEEIKNKKIQSYKDIYREIEEDNWQERIRKIEDDFKKLKEEKDVSKQIKLASKLKKDLDDIYKLLKEREKKILNELKEIKNYTFNLEEAKKKDIQRISNLIKTPSFDKENIVALLFGERLYNEFAMYSYYFDKLLEIKKYLPENPKKKIFEEKKKRGRYIHYVVKENYPTFLLKKASIEGIFTPENPISYFGSIENLSNNPVLYPKPLVLNISGKKESSSIYLFSKIDLSTTPLVGIFKLDYNGIKLSQIKFGGKKLSYMIDSARLNLNLSTDFVEDLISSSLLMRFYDVKSNALVDLGQRNIDNILKNSLEELNSFEVKADVKGKIKEPSIKFTSNIGDNFLKKLESHLKKDIEALRGKIEQKVKLEVETKIKELNDVLKDQEYKILEILKANNERIERIRQDIEKDIKKKIKL